MQSQKKPIRIQLDHQKLAKERSNFWVTTASRLLKGFAGIFLFLPLTMISFGIVCFQKNEWPWSHRL